MADGHTIARRRPPSQNRKQSRVRVLEARGRARGVEVTVGQ